MEIREKPFEKELYGTLKPVPEGQKPGQVMFAAMDATWAAVRASQARTKGINHILYSGSKQVFAGVEVESQPPAGLEKVDVRFGRYAYHRLVGGYDQIAGAYQGLNELIAERKLTPSGESMEIYGHHSEDPAEQVTEILIGLR